MLPRPRDLAENDGSLVRGASVVEAVIDGLAQPGGDGHHLNRTVGGAEIGM